MAASTYVQAQNGSNAEIIRPVANFTPNLWGDLFLHYTPLDQAAEKQKVEEVEELKDEVRKLLTIGKDPKERLLQIDAINRLGVAYCFQDDIEAHLYQFHSNSIDDASYKDDLHYASLRFRLLRQHGFRVSCDVFEGFKDENERFKESLSSDVQGILNLYEACHLKLRREKILDEALAFTTPLLKTLASNSSLSTCLANQISHALKRPFYKCNTRLEVKYQLPFYELDASRYDALLRLAKLDFNMLQQLYRKELSDIIGWTRRLSFKEKFPFSRDVLPESYVWTIGVGYEPQFCRARTSIMKVFKLITVIDDIYDAYGTIEELEPFTEAILRWDISCMNQLPEYMQLIYQIMLDTFQDFEHELANEGMSSCIVYYLQEEMKVSCQAYLQEARWRHKKYIPAFDEYVKNGMVTSVYCLLLLAAYHGIGDIATKDAIDWVRHRSKAMKASCLLARLWDDMGGHEFEQKRNHVASAVECYMASFSCVSVEEAYKELQKQVEEAWMDLTEEMLRPTSVPMPLLLPIINMTRVLYDVYGIGIDGFNMPITIKDVVEAYLIEPAM